LPISFGKKRRCLRTNACTTTQNIVRKSIAFWTEAINIVNQ
jgi:hypothetical protein